MYFKPFHLNNTDQIIKRFQTKYKLFEDKLLPSDHFSEEWDEIKKNMPELDAEFKRLNLTPKEVFLFQVSGRDDAAFSPHIDTPGYFTIALNFPVFNCKGTQLVFYKTTKPMYTDRFGQTPWGTILAVSPSICETVTSLELTSPHLVNTQEIHAVVNHTDKIRFVVSFRFEEDLSVFM